MDIFYGTPAELSAYLLSLYSDNKTFEISQINYSPSEDVFVGDSVFSTTSGSNTLTIRFDNSSDEQLTGLTLFDDSYTNFDREIFLKGCVYQLTLLSVYKDSSDAVKTHCPNVSGSWAAWEMFWTTHTIPEYCRIYAAVNLVEGYPYTQDAEPYYPGLLRAHFDKNVLVTSDMWESDSTYPDYIYSCRIGTTALINLGLPNMDNVIPTVIFAHDEAISGNYSPFLDTWFVHPGALCGAKIFSKVNTEITIPVIKYEVIKHEVIS